MKKYNRIMAVLLTVALIVCLMLGCTQKTPETGGNLPVLTVHIPSNLEKSATMAVLRDPAFVRLVEQNLHYKLEIHVLPAEMDYNEVALLDFNGILLTDDPAWVVPLVESRKLVTLPAVLDHYEYGQYNNNMYGYVLDDPSCKPQSIVVLANREALQDVQVSQMAFTPENVYNLLADLKKDYRIPLAVSGMPTDGCFAPLLALFDMAPSGGREMYVEDGEVVYDKISGSAEDYLRYIQTLYTEGLIPGDVVELTQYSCAKLIAQNAAAMAVFTDQTYVKLALQYAAEHDRQLVYVEIPIDDSLLQTGIFSRMVGYVSKSSISEQQAVTFFELLQQQIALQPGKNQGVNIDRIGQYALFKKADRTTVRQDPREACPVYVYWLYQKEYLDMTYLDGIYCKILLGEADVLELQTSSESWLLDSGLLNLIAGKYWAQTHKGG